MFFTVQLLVGLVSAYRYEGPRVNEEAARAEAEALGAAVKSAAGGKLLAENGDVVRILSTRSKPHLVETLRRYKEIHGRRLEEDVAYRARDKPYCNVREQLASSCAGGAGELIELA